MTHGHVTPEPEPAGDLPSHPAEQAQEHPGPTEE